MLGWPRTALDGLRRAWAAADRELRLLEEDLGLCARCGERRRPRRGHVEEDDVPGVGSGPAGGSSAGPHVSPML
jgi:hypothetical protein